MKSEAGVQLLEAPIEGPNYMIRVERYHAPLRVAFNKIRTELRSEVQDYECLNLSVYANNFTVGPKCLFPTLLVFGAFPRPIRNTT